MFARDGRLVRNGRLVTCEIMMVSICLFVVLKGAGEVVELNT